MRIRLLESISGLYSSFMPGEETDWPPNWHPAPGPLQLSVSVEHREPEVMLVGGIDREARLRIPESRKPLGGTRFGYSLVFASPVLRRHGQASFETKRSWVEIPPTRPAHRLPPLAYGHPCRFP